jgi:outer membrane receptor protein involved in Fe transport
MRWFWLALLMTSAGATSAFAEDSPPPISLTIPTATPTTSGSGVISYPAPYFADQRPNTAYDMITRLPGFAFDDGNAIRGFAGTAGNVLIDGQRPTSKTDDLQSILKRLSASQVERIDVISGGAPGIDMQGKTVVANVIRKKGGGFTGDMVLVNIKTDDGRDVPQGRLEGSWTKDGRTLEASLLLAKFFDDGQGSGPHYVYGPDGHVLDFSPMHNMAGGWQNTAVASYETPLYGGKFKINLMVQDQPYANDSLDRFLVAGTEAEHDRQDKTDAELGLHYNKDLMSGLSLEVLGLQHLNKTATASVFDTPGDTQLFGLTDFGGESIARGILHWRPSDTLTIDGGGEFAYNWLTTRTVFTDNGAPIQVPAGDVKVNEKRAEVFTTATWRPSPQFTVEAGMRVEDSTITSTGDVVLTKTLVYPKPRLLVTWSPDPLDQVRVRVEREVGQLDFNSFVASASLNGSGVLAGNPNLVPQQDWAFEVAYDRHFWKDGVVSLTARHLILTDVVDRVPVFDPSGTFDEPGNIGGGTENDLVASFSLPLERFGIKGGLFKGLSTWRSAQVTDPTTGEKRGISGQHPIDAELHFSQDLPRWKLNWGVDTSIGWRERYFRFDEIDTYKAGTFNSVFIEYKPQHDLALRFELDNAGRRPFDITRRVFDGPRNTAPLDFTDFQDHNFGLELYMRVRKTFG